MAGGITGWGPKSLWLDPEALGRRWLMVSLRAAGGSEGGVVNAAGHLGIFLRPEAVGRGRLHGSQDGLQNNLQGKEGTQSFLGAWQQLSPPTPPVPAVHDYQGER